MSIHHVAASLGRTLGSAAAADEAAARRVFRNAPLPFCSHADFQERIPPASGEGREVRGEGEEVMKFSPAAV